MNTGRKMLENYQLTANEDIPRRYGSYFISACTYPTPYENVAHSLLILTFLSDMMSAYGLAVWRSSGFECKRWQEYWAYKYEKLLSFSRAIDFGENICSSNETDL